MKETSKRVPLRKKSTWQDTCMGLNYDRTLRLERLIIIQIMDPVKQLKFRSLSNAAENLGLLACFNYKTGSDEL